VVGASGGLTGYAGGLRRKRILLDLEQQVAGRSVRLF
jgi:methylated-DNA-[protein]-cysteine S-methyltransferase